jgi:hypothetical protein
MAICISIAISDISSKSITCLPYRCIPAISFRVCTSVERGTRLFIIKKSITSCSYLSNKSTSCFEQRTDIVGIGELPSDALTGFITKNIAPFLCFPILGTNLKVCISAG